MPQDPPDRRLCHRRPQRNHLPPAAALADLEGGNGFPRPTNAACCTQIERFSGILLQRHHASAVSAVCVANAFVLEERYEVMASWTYEMHEIYLRRFLNQYNQRIQIILNN